MTVVSKIIKRKTQKRLRRFSLVGLIITFTWLLSSVEFSILIRISEGSDMTIIDFYTCDALGTPQDYFPKKTTAFFNVSVRNLASDPKNVSLYLTVQDELNVPIGSDQLDTTVPPNVSTYYIMSTFIPKWAYVGVAKAYVSVFVEGAPVDSKSTEFYIGPEDLIPPVIHLLSPQNVTYETESVSLLFTVDERTAWMGYSLNRLENVTVAGNTTLASLTNGSYSVIVYANDTSGNVGFSEEVYFTVIIIHDVAVIDLKCSSKEVYIGDIVDMSVLVQNEGTVTETFNVTTYVNTTAIETLTVTDLPRGNQTVVDFSWDTMGFAEGNYSVIACAELVPSEIDITDNTYVDGIVNVMPRPDIQVTNVKSSRTLVGRGYSISVNVTIKNKVDYIETFNVIVYVNATIMGIREVTITGRSIMIVTFTWNTTGFDYGGYTMKAVADVVPGETFTEDNTFVDGWIVVTIPGDVNGDFRVEGKDNGAVAKAYDTRPGDPRWIENADLNCDGKVEGKDIAIVFKYFGAHYP